MVVNLDFFLAFNPDVYWEGIYVQIYNIHVCCTSLSSSFLKKPMPMCSIFGGHIKGHIEV